MRIYTRKYPYVCVRFGFYLRKKKVNLIHSFLRKYRLRPFHETPNLSKGTKRRDGKRSHVQPTLKQIFFSLFEPFCSPRRWLRLFNEPCFTFYPIVCSNNILDWNNKQLLKLKQTTRRLKNNIARALLHVRTHIMKTMKYWKGK